MPQKSLSTTESPQQRIDPSASIEAEGDCLADAGQWHEAEQCYRQALALNPDSAALWWKLAAIQLDAGRSCEAAASFQTAVDHSTAAGDPLLKTAAWRGLAEASWRLHQPQRALQAVEQVLACEPENPWNWLLAALIYEFAGLRSCAALAHTRALELDPDLEIARDGLQRLNESPALA